MFSKRINNNDIFKKYQKDIDELKTQIFLNEYFQSNSAKIIDKISLSLSSSKLSGTSSNAIEGIFVLKNQNRITNKNANQLIINYNEILNYIKDYTPEIKLNKNTILSWHHKLFSHTIQSESIAGKFKNSINKVIDNKGNVLMVGSEPWETPLLIDELCEWYEKSELDFLIKIPIFIFDFLSIHPFSDGNGRISRLLTNFLLMKENVFFLRYESLEHTIFELQNEYLISLSKCNENWKEHNNDYSSFIEFNLMIIKTVFDKFINSLTFVSRLNESNLNKKQLIVSVIDFLLKKQRNISKRDIINFIECYSLKISERTIEIVISFLISNNYLKYSGRTKGIKYFDLFKNVEEILSKLN